MPTMETDAPATGAPDAHCTTTPFEAIGRLSCRDRHEQRHNQRNCETQWAQNRGNLKTYLDRKLRRRRCLRRPSAAPGSSGPAPPSIVGSRVTGPSPAAIDRRRVHRDQRLHSRILGRFEPPSESEAAGPLLVGLSMLAVLLVGHGFGHPCAPPVTEGAPRAGCRGRRLGCPASAPSRRNPRNWGSVRCASRPARSDRRPPGARRCTAIHLETIWMSRDVWAVFTWRRRGVFRA